MGYEHYSPTAGAQSPMVATPDTAASAFSWRQAEPLPRIHEDVLCRAWQTDPYVSDPQSVTNTVSSLLAQLDATALRFLPDRAVFMAWLQNSAHQKSPEDLMLVYSILAAGAALSPQGEARGVAHEYAQVARYATERAALSLQLVQARLVLSLYYLAVSRPADADDMSSGAIAAATCLQLNLELERARDGALAVFPCGLTAAGYARCRNRTFWACFLLERLNGLFPTRVAIINKDDIFVRLPAGGRDTETRPGAPAPLFDPGLAPLEGQQQQSVVGVMGYLVQVTALWGEVMACIYRMSHGGAPSEPDLATFRHSAVSRLAGWQSSLVPVNLQFSPANLARMTPEDRGAFILMHLVFHLAMVKLHRHLHPRPPSPQQQQQQQQQQQHAVTAAREHASKILDIVCAVARERSSSMPPFTSAAVFEAADVLTAGGGVRELGALVDRLAVARSVLEVLGATWGDARAHLAAVDQRLDGLVALRDRVGGAASASASAAAAVAVAAAAGGGAGGGGGGSVGMGGLLRVYAAPGGGGGGGAAEKGREGSLCWRIVEPLETRFPREMDCVYDHDDGSGGSSS